MTGYGRGRVAMGETELIVDARAVNHRFLDVRVRAPSELLAFAGAIEELARARLVRGRIEVTVHSRGVRTTEVRLDRDRARAAFRDFTELASELGVSEPVPLSLLSAVPDLFQVGEADVSDLEREVRAAAAAAFGALDAMRVREGEALRREFERLLEELRQCARTIAADVPDVVARYRSKLHERIETLMDSVAVSLDSSRLEHEVALFADRADITEELTRIASHADQFESLLTSGGPAGRKFDFLLQELGREANTVGAKCSDANLSHHVVELKATLERMREQAQNVL